MAKAKKEQLIVNGPELEYVNVHIKGTAPLVVHQRSEKAKEAIKNKALGIASSETNPKRDAEYEYNSSFYILSDGRFGFPTGGVKECVVASARCTGEKMTELRQWFSIRAPEGLIPVIGEPLKRDDFPRISQSAMQISFRGQFPEWEMKVPVRYLKNRLSETNLSDYFIMGGEFVGIGAGRPERGGENGTFVVVGLEFVSRTLLSV